MLVFIYVNDIIQYNSDFTLRYESQLQPEDRFPPAQKTNEKNRLDNNETVCKLTPHPRTLSITSKIKVILPSTLSLKNG